jgi:hypothetical protein
VVFKETRLPSRDPSHGLTALIVALVAVVRIKMKADDTLFVLEGKFRHFARPVCDQLDLQLVCVRSDPGLLLCLLAATGKGTGKGTGEGTDGGTGKGTGEGTGEGTGKGAGVQTDVTGTSVVTSLASNKRAY